ncbi:MAG: hypothetical protein ACLVAO_11335 [Clostridium fessum]
MSREMKDSGVEWLGEIPKGWNVKKGKALYSITTGKLDANAEEPTGIYPFFYMFYVSEKNKSVCIRL